MLIWHDLFFAEDGFPVDEVNAAGGVEAFLATDPESAGAVRISGTDQPDQLVGDELDSWMFGHEGDDILDAGAGADYLDGGLGNDTLTGGDGSDAFVLTVDGGADVVLDFTPHMTVANAETGTEDVFLQDQVLVRLPEFQDGSTELTLDVTADAAGNAVVNYGEATLTLVGWAPEGLQADWFSVV